MNAAPLTQNLDSQVIYATPAKLAQMLRADELDAALVSITEVLLNDRYDILDGVAIASLGEVYSVFLAHKKPIAEITEVYCDTASLTSVNLLKGSARRARPETGIQAAGRLCGRRRKGFCPAYRRHRD